MNSASPNTYRFNADSFREGLAKAGFVEGRNVRIEERWAHGDYDALPALAADLIGIGVTVIAATGDVASARAAQNASSAVPVVFTIRSDAPFTVFAKLMAALPVLANVVTGAPSVTASL